jgi:hypothetical protein
MKNKLEQRDQIRHFALLIERGAVNDVNRNAARFKRINVDPGMSHAAHQDGDLTPRLYRARRAPRLEQRDNRPGLGGAANRRFDLRISSNIGQALKRALGDRLQHILFTETDSVGQIHFGLQFHLPSSIHHRFGQAIRKLGKRRSGTSILAKMFESAVLLVISPPFGRILSRAHDETCKWTASDPRRSSAFPPPVDVRHPVACEEPDDLCLDFVGILKLIDQDCFELPLATQPDILESRKQIARLQEQVIEVQDRGRSLSRVEVLNKQVRQLGQFHRNGGSGDLTDTRQHLAGIIAFFEWMLCLPSILLVRENADLFEVAVELLEV